MVIGGLTLVVVTVLGVRWVTRFGLFSEVRVSIWIPSVSALISVTVGFMMRFLGLVIIMVCLLRDDSIAAVGGTRWLGRRWVS